MNTAPPLAATLGALKTGVRHAENRWPLLASDPLLDPPRALPGVVGGGGLTP